MAYIGKNPKYNSSTYTPQSSDPSNPAEGMVYRSDGTARPKGLWEYRDGGWLQIGTGSEPADFISGDNRNFDSSIGDWVAYQDAAQAQPEDMIGGSPTVTITQTGTSPLVGDGMGVITKDAADRQGEGVSLSGIAIPDGYRGVPLLVRVITEASANYIDGDVVVNAFDETNSNLLGAASNPDQGGVRGPKNIYEAIVYPADSTETIRLGFHIATTNASAWTLNIDEVQLVWVPYIKLPNVEYIGKETWNSLQTNSTVTVNVYRNGSKVFVDGIVNYTGSAFTFFTAGAEIPSKYAVDLNKQEFSPYTLENFETICVVGNALVIDTDAPESYDARAVLATDDYGGGVPWGTNTVLGFVRTQNNALHDNIRQIGQSAYGIETGNTITFFASWHVDGWEDTSVSALAINSGLISGELTLSTSQNIGASGVDIIEFDNASNSLSSYYDTSNYTFTSPRKARYLVGGKLATNGALTNGADLQVFINGTQAYTSNIGAEDGGAGASFYLDLEQGDEVYFRAKANLALAWSLVGTSSSIKNTWVYIQEIPFSQTALISGDSKIGSEAWSDNQANATTTATLWRSGNKVKAQIEMSFTGALSGNTFITIPAAYTASNLYNIGTSEYYFTAQLKSNGVFYKGTAALNGANQFQIYVDNTSTTYATLSNTTASVPNSWGAGDTITFFAEWEVEGW